MEPPPSFNADMIRDEKIKVTHGAVPTTPPTSRTTWCEGSTAGLGRRQEVIPYREEKGAAADSVTETYLALEVGDRQLALGRRAVVHSCCQAHAEEDHRGRHPLQAGAAFDVQQGGGASSEPNVLVLRIQPDEGISLRFSAKVPGATLHARAVNMDFIYGSSFMVSRRKPTRR